MSLSCVTGGKLCTGCMTCQEDPRYWDPDYRYDDDSYYFEDKEDYIDD